MLGSPATMRRPGGSMRRRDFVSGLSGAVALWPHGVRAQQPERVRRIGVLMNVAADHDPVAHARLNAFMQGLRQLGWTEGRNIEIDVRWGTPDADRYRKDAAELVAQKLDVVLAASGATMPALAQATRTIPVVFLLVPDP